MGLLTFSINVTLDGCVDHREGTADDETHTFFTRLMDEGGAMLWGRVTYEMMENYWPAVARGDEEAPPAVREWAVKLEAKPKYKFLVYPRIAGHGPTPVPKRAEHATARARFGEAAPQRRGRHALPARADSEQPRPLRSVASGPHNATAARRRRSHGRWLRGPATRLNAPRKYRGIGLVGAVRERDRGRV